jgi:toxin ParE1/3/4
MHSYWTPQAILGLEAIRDYYISCGSPKTAKIIGRALFEAGERLSSLPNTGRAGRVPNTRELVIPHTPFILVYRLHNDNPHILAILHSSRNWPEQF